MLAPWNAADSAKGAGQSPRLDHTVYLIILSLSYLTGVAVHALELPAWLDPALVMDGEFIQGTHDSYHWLAGAKGVGEAVGTPLAVMAAWFSRLTTLPVGMASFVIPPLFAGLVAAVMVLWCRTLGREEGATAGGLVAGLLTVIAPGFFFRTRLGYYDTDLVTLLFPLLFCVGMAMAFGQWLRPTWWKPAPMLNERPRDLLRMLLWMAVLGLLARWGAVWHGHILTFAKALCALAIFWTLAAARSGARGRLLWGVTVFMASALVGWTGLALSAALLLAAWKTPARLQPLWQRPWTGLATLVLLAVLGGVAQSAMESTTSLLGAYLKPAADVTSSSNTTGVVYPGIGQSVIEVQNIPLDQVLERFNTSMPVAVAGILCFCGVLVLRPQALPMVLLLCMGLASVKLGSRLTMFGGAPMALGLGMALGWIGVALFRGSRFAAWKQLALCLVAAIVLAWPTLSFYSVLPPTPVLSRQHCQALKFLTGSPADSKVWTWWDWGYPTHYYAQRISFADGGRHYGHHIFPLGLALTTPNALLSSQLIKYSGQHQDEPWTVWDKMPREEVLGLLQDLGKTPREFPAMAPRYLVVTFENIRLAPWITYYGTWNMLTQQGTHGRTLEIRDSFRINYDAGEVQFTQKPGSLPVTSIDVLDAKTRRSAVYPNNQGAHLVVHLAAQKYYLLDDQIYNSLMVQLLLDDAKNPRYASQFKLVYEGYPDVRVYEVR